MTGLLLALTLISPNTLVVPTMMSPMGISEVRAINKLTVAPMPTTAAPVAIKPPKPAVVTKQPIVPPKPMTLATQVTNTVTFATLPAPWRCIVRHESTYNLTAVNYKSGTEGAFQFDPATWQEFAPPSFPASPLQATLTQQFIVAKAVEAARGFGQWETAPLCGV